MASRTRAAERYRCLACRGRWRHKKRLKREPRCPHCGERIRYYSIEAERRRELAKQDTCHCNAYPFPHRAGSMRMCDTHPLAGVEPTQEEIYDYQGCLETPRSGFY